MNRLFLLAWFSITSGFATGQEVPASFRIDPDNFEELHQLMQPGAEELKWREIPWHTNVWEARREAALAGKPVYLWEMDGHPLGCT